MGNDALRVNGNTAQGVAADIAITTRGSDWYWAVTAVMTVSTLVFYAMSFMRPRTHRLFHYITASITLVAAIAYFTMASNLGWTAIAVEFVRGKPKVAGHLREIFYARYIDWFITTPLLLLDILLTAGLPWPTILVTILLDEVMIVTGLIGALVRSSYKWGYFVFGCLALLAVVYNIIWTGRRHANALGADVGRTYLACAGLTLFVWFLYPIAWGLAEGGNVISPDSEAIFYGILDLIAKPVFGVLLLVGHRSIDPARLGIRIRDYDQLPSEAGHHDLTDKSRYRNGAADPVLETPTVPATTTTTTAAAAGAV